MKRILASLAVILGIALLLSTDRRATRLRVVGSAFALQAAPACAASVPADLAKRPARWLGGCARGKAEGPGVLRLGTTEPFQFFTGTMKAGRPVRGVLKVNASQLVAAYAFDQWLEAIVPDGNRPVELDATFRTGSAGAAAVARRFAAAGNKASAAYYQRMADHYREPPFE